MKLTTTPFLLVMLFLVLALILVAIFLRSKFKTYALKDLATKNTGVLASLLKKYPEVDVFRYSLPIFLFGLLVTLVAVTSSFMYTTFTIHEPVTQAVMIDWDDEIETEDVPRTSVEVPPPPPPPPDPIIDETKEDDEEELETQKIDEEDVNLEKAPVVDTTAKAPPKPKVVKKAPPPPPPPPVEKNDDQIYTNVEEMPRFQSDDCEAKATVDEKYKCSTQALLRHVQGSIKYPALAREQGIQGRVMLSFTVQKDGSITDVSVLKKIGGGCDEEALRVVKALPKFSPGMQGTKPVKVKFNLPVTFRLQ